MLLLQAFLFFLVLLVKKSRIISPGIYSGISQEIVPLLSLFKPDELGFCWSDGLVAKKLHISPLFSKISLYWQATRTEWNLSVLQAPATNRELSFLHIASRKTGANSRFERDSNES